MKPNTRKSPMKFRSPLLFLLAMAAILLGAPAASRATTYYWDASPSLSGTSLNYGSGTIGTTATNWWNTTANSYIGWTNSTSDTMQIGSNSAGLGTSPARSYTGGSTVGSFSLTLGGTTGLNDLVVSSNLSNAGTNTLTITDGGNSGNTLTFGGANEINNQSSRTLIINAQITQDSGTVMFEDLGTVILTKNNGYSNGTVIEGDGAATGSVLQVGTGGMTGALGTGSIQFPLAGGQTSAATLDYDLLNATTVGNSISVPNSNTVGAIIQQSGSNTLTLSGPETIANTSATLTYNIGTTGQAIDAAVSGAISGTGSVIKSGAGTLSFSGNDSYLGLTTINAGTLIISGSGELGGGTYAGNVTIASGASLAYNSTVAQTLSGLVSGTGSVIEDGPGALTFSNTNSYTGATTVNGGNLILAGFNSSGGVQGTLLNSSVAVNTSGTFTFGRPADFGNAASGSTSVTVGQNVTLNGGATLAVATGTNGTNTTTAATLSGALTLASGLNFVTINAAGVTGHYTGLTTGFSRTAGSVLLINAPHTIGNAAPGTTGDENLLFTSGTTLTNSVLPGVFISQSSTPLDATAIATYNTTNGVQLTGVTAYSGTTGSLANASTATAGVSNGNYTGTASGSVNSLRMDDSMNLGGFTLTVSSGMILARTATNGVNNNLSITSGTLAFGASEGQIYLSSNGGTAHNYNTTNTLLISSAITGANGLTITGGWTGLNTVTLSGDDTYTGATTLNTGTLIVSGSLTGTTSAAVVGSSALEVDGLINSAATTTVRGTLDGTGSVGGITANGGTVAPGLSAADSLVTSGTLTAAGAVALSGSTNFNIRLGVLSSGTDSDQLAVTGANTVTLNGAKLNLTIGTAMYNAALAGNTFYTIINGGASGTGTGSDIFSGLAQDSTFTTSTGFEFTILYAANANGTNVGSGNDVVLELDAVPEPGTYVMMLGGLATMLAFQRIRRRSRTMRRLG